MNHAATDTPAPSASSTRPRLRICPNQSGFFSHIGPCYEIVLAGGKRRAIALDHRHLSSEGVVHSAALSSFAEFCLQGAIGDELGEGGKGVLAVIDGDGVGGHGVIDGAQCCHGVGVQGAERRDGDGRVGGVVAGAVAAAKFNQFK